MPLAASIDAIPLDSEGIRVTVCAEGDGSNMEIVRLPPESNAPTDSDCIKISSLPDGTFRLVTSALFEGDSDGDESVAVVGGDAYPDYEAAEAAGITWADEQGVELLYVESSQSPDPSDPGS